MGNKCPCLAPKTGGGGAKEYAVNEDKTKTKKDKKKDDKKNKKKATKYAMPSDGNDNDGFEEPANQGPDEFTNIADIAPNGDGPKLSTAYRKNGTEEVEIAPQRDGYHERPIDVPGEPKVNYKVTKSPDSNHNDTGDIEVHHHQAEGRGGAVSLDDGEEIIDTRLRLPSANLDLDQLTDSQKEQYINPAFDKDSLSSAEDFSQDGKVIKLEKDIDIDVQVKKDKTGEPDSLSQASSSFHSESDIDEINVRTSDILPDEIDLKFTHSDEEDDIQHAKHNTYETKFQLPQEEKEKLGIEEEVGAIAYFEQSEKEDTSDEVPKVQHVKHETYETQIILGTKEKPELETKGQSAYDALMQLDKSDERDSLVVSDGESQISPEINTSSQLPTEEDRDSVQEIHAEREVSPEVSGGGTQMQNEEDTDVDSEVESDAAVQIQTQETKVILHGAIDGMPNESSDFDIVQETDDRESVSSISSEEYKEMAGATVDLNTYPYIAQRENEVVKECTDTVEETKQEVMKGANDEDKIGGVYMDMQVLHSYKRQHSGPDDEVQTMVTSSDDVKPVEEGKSSSESSDDEEGNPVKEDTIEETKVDEEQVKKPTYPWEEDYPDEENRELEEILLLIEKLEESLVKDLTTIQDTEILSRNIVEKLDEISALREQAEMDIPIETIMEDMKEDEDEDEEFEAEDQVIDWYNRRLDELNEAVGMDLLEMSMTKSLTEESLEPIFNQHAESHTYFIRRRLVELEKLRRKKLVTNQKPLFEPQPEEEIELHRPTRAKMYPVDEDSDTEQRSKANKFPRDFPHQTNEETEQILSDTDGNKADGPILVSSQEIRNIKYSSDKAPTVKDDTHPVLFANNKEKDQHFIRKPEQNVFEESDVDMGPGVNQFVSPSKSEEDLWFQVESLHSKDVMSDDDGDNNEEDTDEQEQVPTQEIEQDDPKQHNFEKTPGMEYERFVDQQNVHKHDATKVPAKSILKATMMYGSDSDSENESVNEEDVIKSSANENYNINSTQHASKVSSESEDEYIYSTPSSRPVEVPRSDTQMPKQQSEMDKNSEMFEEVVYNIPPSRPVKLPPSDTQMPQQQQEMDKDIDIDEEQVYNIPSSRPVKLPPSDTQMPQQQQEMDKYINSDEEGVYNIPSSKPVKLPPSFTQMPQQQPEPENEPNFVSTATESANKKVIKARMISRSSSESSSSDDEIVDKPIAGGHFFKVQADTQAVDSEEEDPVYSTPTSLPVRPLLTAANIKSVDVEVHTETEEMSSQPTNDEPQTKSKLTMYGSSSDESETEELIQKAYAMDEAVSSSDSDVIHQVPVMKPPVVQKSESSTETKRTEITSGLNEDTLAVSEPFGAVEYSEQGVVAPNDIFGEFQSETFDKLQSSQDHASDLLSELQALSGNRHKDDEYLETFDHGEMVNVSKKDNNVVLEERQSYAVESNAGLPVNVYSANEPIDFQVNLDYSKDTFQNSVTDASITNGRSRRDDSAYIPVTDNNQSVRNVVVEEAVYSPPVDFSSTNEGLMSLTMQPIPPIPDEKYDESEQNIQICSKETGESYPVHVSNGAENSAYNGHQKLSRKQSREIILSDSDTDTDELIKAAVGRDAKQGDVDDADTVQSTDEDDEDTDTEGVIQKYGEALKMKKANPITSLTSDSDDSENDYSESEDEGNNDEYEAEIELKATLKNDIVGSISTLNKDDFATLMGIYRQEREGIKGMCDSERSRVNESLLDKLQRRRQAVDQYVHEGEAAPPHGKSQQTTGVGVQVSPSTHSASVGSSSAQVTETGVGGQGSDSEMSDVNEEDEDVAESMRDAEELTQTIQLMDMEIVQHAADCENKDDVNMMIKEHFDMVEQLRKRKDTDLQNHRNKAKAKLEARSRKLSTSSSEDSCNDENTSGKDAFIDREMDTLRESYLDAITSRDQVSEQELHDVLVQYREDQQDLIRKREFEKLRINEKLRERMNAKKNRQLLSRREAEPEQTGNLGGGAGRDEEHLSQMSKMDEDFYKELYRLHAKGELDEEEMGHMIEMHLDRAEEFKRKVKGEVEKRRKRRDKMTDSRRIKQADLIIQTEKEEAKKIRQMREQEKQVSDSRLQQKLQRKKKYEDTPALPPAKRPSKEKRNSSRASHVQMSNYENVEYEC